jgi:oligopeptide/dipeptide ABC transporter ATP-binding protein
MLIDIKNLCTWFQISPKKTVHAVDNISLQIAEHQTLGLVGESGSGKTTLGKTLTGLLNKTSGEVWYRNKRLPQQYSSTDFKRYSNEIQMIFQDPYASLNPRMTVAEIIGEPLRLQRQGKTKNDKEAIAHWLEMVGLQADHMSRYPHEFSGGQRQRIGIARALITEPDFVVCDEPISALDVSVQAQIVNLLQNLQKNMGLTLLFIAHDLSMVRYISDRMAVMYLGSLVEEGSASQVYSAPLHPYTKLLVASNPEPDPRREKARTHQPIQGEIPSPINIQPGCRFAGRCPQAMPNCHQQTPELKEQGNNHRVACHLYD